MIMFRNQPFCESTPDLLKEDLHTGARRDLRDIIAHRTGVEDSDNDMRTRHYSGRT